jgi:hypothetical protein
MKPSLGCSGINSHACTQLWATSAPSSLNNSGIEQPKQSQADLAERAKQAMAEQESKVRFPTFPQPRRLRTITQYGIRILRPRSHLQLAYRSTMRLTHILVSLHLVGRNFIGESPDLAGLDFAGFLEKKLDRKDRQAGRNSRPEASQPALSTAIHPG